MSEPTPPAIDSPKHTNGHAHAGNGHGGNGHAHNGAAADAPALNGHGALNGHATEGTTIAATPTRVEDAPATNPSISLIIPALNEEKLIERTLLAFNAELRTRYDVEMIVSDGGSHDRTVEIAREHADRVVVHSEKRRQTIAEGRNRGAEVARGDLLVFINADTVPRDPESFMRELTTIAGSERRKIAYACPVEVLPEERRLSDRLFHGFFNNYVRLLNSIGVGMGRGECQVMWRDSFRSVGGYNNAMVAGEDFDLYSRLARHGSIGHHADLCVYESPRRFRRYGYIRVLASWTANALSVIFLHRSISTEWEEIR